MSSKIKFVFGASVLGILGIFTFKIFLLQTMSISLKIRTMNPRNKLLIQS